MTIIKDWLEISIRDSINDGPFSGVPSYDGDWRSYTRWPYKILWNSLGNHLLYDLEVDPNETSEIGREQPARARALLDLLVLHAGSLRRAEPGDDVPTREIDAETRRALESLGYLE